MAEQILNHTNVVPRWFVFQEALKVPLQALHLKIQFDSF
jgi:hypothetical protein